MSEPKLRDVLIKQNGTAGVDGGLDMLDRLLDQEERRVRRLKRWTIAVWVAWVACILLNLVLWMAAHRSGPPPATAPVVPSTSSSGALALIMMLIILISMAGIFGLPIVGLVLLVMTFVARRSANANRIQASLAAIDAQLKSLAAQRQQS